MQKTNSSSADDSGSTILYRILIGAFILIIILLLLVAVALVITQKPVDLSQPILATNSDTQATEPGSRLRFRQRRPENYRKFTFDDVFSGKIFARDSYTTAWRKDGSLLRVEQEYEKKDGGVLITYQGTMESVKYLEEASFIDKLSADGQYGYMKKVMRSGFRHSKESLYEIARIENGKINKVTFPVGMNGSLDAVSVFLWNPHPQKHDFVFVHDFNIYYQSDPEKPGTAVQLTEDGISRLRYGLSDWLYEEEILSSENAIWWSETGRYIAYLRFDDRAVSTVFLPQYYRNVQYAQFSEIPYPKAGVVNNPITTLYIYDRVKNKAVIAFPPEELTMHNQSFYIFSNNWIMMPSNRKELGEERLLTIWTNREQNQLYVTLCHETDCLLTFTQSYTINGKSLWAEPTDFKNIFYSATGFFIIFPRPYSDGNIYNHIAHVEIEPAGSGRITVWHGGAYDVKEVLGYDAERDILTFSSVGGGIGTYKLYKIEKATQSQASSITTLSALIPECEYGSFSVSPTGRTAVITCARIFDNAQLWKMEIRNPQQNQLLDGFEPAYIPFDKPTLHFETAKLASGYEVNIGFMLPPMFDPSLKYPLLLDIYGGPNSNKVRKSTPNPNMFHFTSNYGIIVAWVDGRGSANKGWNIKAPVYKNLGMYEAIDTIDAIRYLSKKYPYIDASNVAVFGWSYGGFLAAHIAARDQGSNVKCAIAVAPVTDFSIYDSAYTERYMGMPLENPGGYNASQLVNKANLMKNVKIMVAHGLADDNVHYQNSALLTEALQAQMIHFNQLVYANQDHSMGTRVEHLFMEINRFIAEDCFEINKT